VSALHPESCLFCRQNDGGFTSEEHVFPAGLGNEERIVPPGVVCDRCNNRTLSKVDRALLDFPPVALVRTIRALQTRSGRIPESGWDNATISSSKAQSIFVDDPTGSAFIDHGGGKLQMKLQCKLEPSTYRNISRAIYKMALESIYLDHGPTLAFDSKFDEVRQITLGRITRPGWVMLLQRSEAHQRITLSYWLDLRVDDVEIVPIELDICGISLTTEMLARDAAHIADVPDADANKLVF
jgi:hypothetical protein